MQKKTHRPDVAILKYLVVYFCIIFNLCSILRNTIWMNFIMRMTGMMRNGSQFPHLYNNISSSACGFSPSPSTKKNLQACGIPPARPSAGIFGKIISGYNLQQQQQGGIKNGAVCSAAEGVYRQKCEALWNGAILWGCKYQIDPFEPPPPPLYLERALSLFTSKYLS